MHIFFLGYPGSMGGANTECWHTAKVWRQHGVEVTFIPTWGRDQAMEDRLCSIGCRTIHVPNAGALAGVPRFAGAPVVAMCNAHVTRCRKLLKDLGCKLVWANCMTFMFPDEFQAFQEHGPAEAYVFQSEFQRAELEPRLLGIGGYSPAIGHLVRGALDFATVPFRPRLHREGEEFVVGRLSRPDLDKVSSNLWPILAGVPYDGRRALVMGWNRLCDRKCGPRPPWAECLAPQHIEAADFLARCHAMLGLNGGARENWPRIGLEAMAAGVPIVAQNQWGWKEMIVHGKTGFLCDSDADFKFYLAQLARDERLRRCVIDAAAEHVRKLADPQEIGRQWIELFESLGA